MFNGARVVGPALAGIVVAAIGEGWCFFANGISFLAVIAGLAMMKIDRPRMAIEGSPLENIIEGFRFVAKSGPVRALMMLLGLVVLRPCLMRCSCRFLPTRFSTAAPRPWVYSWVVPALARWRRADSGDEKDPQGTECLGGCFMRRIWPGPAGVFLFRRFGFPRCCWSRPAFA